MHFESMWNIHVESFTQRLQEKELNILLAEQ